MDSALHFDRFLKLKPELIRIKKDEKFTENKGRGRKKGFLPETVVAASRSHYLLRTVTSLKCHKQPER